MGKKITTEDFLKKIKEKFPNETDDLSKVKYFSSKDKITIICPKHGEYYMQANNYLNGQRCPKCKYEKFSERMKKYKTNEDFIKDVKMVHGDKYDLSKVDYVNNRKNILIGYKNKWYYISPNNLLKGHEPKEIAMKESGLKKRMTTEEFIEKAKKVHGDRYDYSKSVYVDSHTPLCIILHEIDPVTDKEYGEFWQTPNHHLHGYGHPKLSGRGYSKEEIIYFFNKIHNNKYDYSKIVYPSTDKQTIICPIHGEFLQSLYKHRRGEGCPKCGGTLKKTNEEFIQELKDIYHDKYDLSKINYTNSDTKVTLICSKHGEYDYLPSQLLRGSGCKFCKCSISENKIEQLLYKNEIDFIPQCNCLKLKWLGKQSLDFFLPKYNIGIECQGCQHFRPIKAFRGNETFMEVLRRDEEKRQKCKENGLRLIYYTNEHTIPLWFKEKYYIYTDKESLIMDIITNKVKDIYYETSSSKENH